jgi:hypothetical protein
LPLVKKKRQIKGKKRQRKEKKTYAILEDTIGAVAFGVSYVFYKKKKKGKKRCTRYTRAP